MPVVVIDRFKRADIRAHSERFYVFGDNFAKEGRGGQARECRGERNCIGIPTKRAPHMGESAFLSDEDLEEWRKCSETAFVLIGSALARGYTVVMPSAGIGTGMAQLEQRAPTIWAELNTRLLELTGVDNGGVTYVR